VLHELGHSLVAQALGIRVRSITLFLFGGVAQLESEPRKPVHEVGIALAGPAVSIAPGRAGACGREERRVNAAFVARPRAWRSVCSTSRRGFRSTAAACCAGWSGQ
jgi:hypothetical protein